MEPRSLSDVQAASFWRIRPGFSYLNIDLSNEPRFNSPSTVYIKRGVYAKLEWSY
jgi:hypothetical protein